MMETHRLLNCHFWQMHHNSAMVLFAARPAGGAAAFASVATSQHAPFSLSVAALLSRCFVDTMIPTCQPGKYENAA